MQGVCSSTLCTHRSSLLSGTQALQLSLRPITGAVRRRSAQREGCIRAQADTEVGSAPAAFAISGLVACPVVLASCWALKTTGEGLPPGPGGVFGALEGLSYLQLLGLVGWSIYTKVKTGKGLPAGPSGLIGAAEGLSYLTVLVAVGVFGIELVTKGSLPGPTGR